MANRKSTSSLSYKRHPNKRSNNNNNNNNSDMQSSSSATTYAAGFPGTAAIKRIRHPHPHDVLSGRGGGINGHEGNVRFRAWVAQRKNDYNLAPSKVEKAQVARQVIAVVQNQDPPGRFLQKDRTMASTSSSSGSTSWWIELDDERRMAKTSQALREGAPLIRAAHKDELQQQQKQRKSAKTTTTRTPPTAKTTTTTTTTAAAAVPTTTTTTTTTEPFKRKLATWNPRRPPLHHSFYQ